MTARTARRLAQTLWAAAIVVTALALVFLALSWSKSLPAGTFGFRGFTVIFAIVFSTVGAVVASRRPENPIGWLLLAAGVGSAIQEFTQEYAVFAIVSRPEPLVGGEVAAWVPAWIWVPITSLAAVFLLPVFPDGRLLSRGWWRVVPIVGAVGVGVATFGLALTKGQLENFRVADNPFGVLPSGADVAIAGLSLYMVAMLGGVASLVVRFRRSRGDERQQMKWLALAASIAAIVLSSSFFSPGIQGQAAETTASNVLETLVIVSFAMIPLAVGIAVLKYRLYEIDVVINKAVVYALLAAFIALVYVAIVVGVGAAVGSGGNAVLSAAAAAVVALAFQPVRRRAQRLANRLVYGTRATPYEVLSEFADRLAGSYSVEDVLPRMARLVAEGTGAARVGVWLHAGDGFRPAATWPDAERSADGTRGIEELPGRAFQVRHQGELLGAISVSMATNEPISPEQERLTADVASQAGLVLRNAGLLEDLRASRLRLVAAQDAERRRLERDIHDGAQQQLVALAVQLRLLEQQIDRDPSAAKASASRLQAAATTALEDLRDLARGIYPPLLADKGLAAALVAQARKSVVPTTVLADGVGRYSQEAEAAVYFCVLEALQNVAKYASASRVDVRLGESAGALTFSVEDDGAGFDPTSARGSGLTNMRDRLEALDGNLEVRSTPGAGTVVTGRVAVVASGRTGG